MTKVNHIRTHKQAIYSGHRPGASGSSVAVRAYIRGMNNHITLYVFLKKGSANKDGKCPIILRVLKGGAVKNCSTRQRVHPVDWDPIRQMVKGNNELARSINQLINDWKAKILHGHNLLATKGTDPVTLDALFHFLSGVTIEDTVLTILTGLINEKIKQLRTNENLQRVNFLKRSKGKLQKFLIASYGKEDMLIQHPDFNRALFPRYKSHLLNSMAENSAIGHLKVLKRIDQFAFDQGLTKKRHFAKETCPYAQTPPRYRTLQELQAIANVDVSDSPKLEITLDMWVFATWTGMGWGDLFNLCKSNIVTRDDGSLGLYFRRKKTNVLCSFPLLSIPKKILEKYAEHPRLKSDKVFPVMSNQKTNDYCKLLALRAKISGVPLTFYQARHSYATLALSTAGCSIETISATLGHTNTKVTRIYARLIDSKISNDLKLLENTISESFTYPPYPAKKEENNP